MLTDLLKIPPTSPYWLPEEIWLLIDEYSTFKAVKKSLEIILRFPVKVHHKECVELTSYSYVSTRHSWRLLFRDCFKYGLMDYNYQFYDDDVEAPYYEDYEDE